MAIKNDYLVEKRNILNELRANKMCLEELRFFSIYLSKINARDSSTRVVRFPISDFQKIMGIGRVKIDYLSKIIDSLLCKIVSVPNEAGGYEKFQLFKKCRVDKDENSEWYVEIDAHDNALPLMFEFKDKYFTYALWNIFYLKSTNQLRMYEILKQYEKIGERVISIADLKALLGIEAKEYSQYGNFRIRVLESCKEALEMYSDIKFTYEPTGKKGKGAKIKALKFTISHNENYIDEMSLQNFISMKNATGGETYDGEKSQIIYDDDEKSQIIYTEFRNERLAFLAAACNNEFDDAEMQVINNLLTSVYPYEQSKYFLTGNNYKYELELYDMLKRSYDELNLYASRKQIKSRFGYLKKMLESDMKKKGKV